MLRRDVRDRIIRACEEKPNVPFELDPWKCDIQCFVCKIRYSGRPFWQSKDQPVECHALCFEYRSDQAGHKRKMCFEDIIFTAVLKMFSITALLMSPTSGNGCKSLSVMGIPVHGSTRQFCCNIGKGDASSSHRETVLVESDLHLYEET